ncbi:SDR family oxidoreductase [Xinfangfangia sp. CPCC 101601]|uniref:SDR family oxidoreductase n=1 Tax=Pseudogemmobacter lacusdianii TaxID=3069608 RepID=A0ABU0VWE1_9RHOB|nr:SDR family oxidoreductase [Xinfangfangia sp. CPCC 101601]MDQ2066044.1 SDR family oxidoreductase [Xinfangfangia sp. CPCC 101601]
MKQPSQPNVIFVTGAASGIGAAFAKMAAVKGHQVVVADINQTQAEAVAQAIGPRALAVALDICDPAAWQNALGAACRHFGRIDVLVNNAGVVFPGRLDEVPLEQHRKTLDVNVMGPMLGMLAALPLFKAQGHGHIVTLCSMTAFMTMPGIVSYAASKSALRALHLGMALEHRDSGVDFTLMHPGATETPMLEREAERGVSAAFARQAVPPEEVAKLVLKALKSKAVEVCIPASRGRFVKAVGMNPARLTELVTRNEAIGAELLAARMAAKTKS